MKPGSPDKISHKILILVFLPLVFELVFIACLDQWLKQVEIAALQSEQSKEIITTTEKIGKLVYDGGMALTSYMQTNAPAWAARYTASSDEMRATVRRLKELVRDNPEELRSAAIIEQNQNKHLARLDRIKEALDDGNRVRAILLSNEITQQDGLPAMATEMQKIVGWEEAKETSSEETARQRQVVRMSLIGMLGMSIVVAVVLALTLGRAITERLSTLMDNTRKLSRKEPLNPPLAGNDEVAQLDRVFRVMAEELAEAARRKQEFVAMVSHDLRAPLTSIKMSFDLIGQGTYGFLSDKGQARVNSADKSIRRLIKLVTDILDIEKMESGNMEMHKEITLTSLLIDRSIEAVRGMAEDRGIRITRPESDFELVADGDRVIQVLVNLLSNAIKFSPADGQVDIGARHDDGWIVMTVSDQGKGIPSEKQQLIFERFKQVDKSDAKEKGGTGLGLAICKAIVEAHAGEIGVTSSAEQGSCFWIKLPA